MKTLHLAGCIVQDKAGGILLLHRNTPKRTQWEIPGGKLEEGEDATAAARREVQEELGVEVEIVRELDTKAFVEDDNTLKYTWFLARIVSGAPGVMEPEVHDECRYFGLEEIARHRADLSPNTVNFLEELQAGRIRLA